MNGKIETGISKAGKDGPMTIKMLVIARRTV